MAKRWETLEQELMGRFMILQEAKRVVIPEWIRNSEYCNPRRVSYNETDQDPTKVRETTGRKTYDSTPQRAASIMVTSFQGMLISPSSRWFRLYPTNTQYADVPYVADYLELVEQEVYNVFTKSNFYEAVNEYILDAVVLGTACLLTEEIDVDGTLHFSARHMREIAISETYGTVDTVTRDFWMQGREIENTWEDLPDHLASRIEQNPYEQFQIIHMVAPTGDFQFDVESTKEFASIYFVPSENNHILEQGGFYEIPYQVWRWRKNSGELYGRSPASDAMNDVKRLDIIAKSLATLDQAIGQPPMNSPEYLRGKGGTKTTPGYSNYYKESGLKSELIDLSRGHGPVREEYELMKDAVLQDFMVPFFLTFSNAQREMTATEVSERMSEKAAILSNVVGRLYQEGVNPIINRVIRTLERSNKLPKLPPELEKIMKEATPRVEMLGPLAQAQRRYHETNGIQAGLRTIGAFAQMSPDAMDNVDFDVSLREALSADGWPQVGIKELPEVAAIRQQKAALMQQQMQAQQAAEAAGTMKDLSTAPQPGSPAEMMMEAQAGAAQQGVAG